MKMQKEEEAVLKEEKQVGNYRKMYKGKKT